MKKYLTLVVLLLFAINSAYSQNPTSHIKSKKPVTVTVAGPKNSSILLEHQKSTVPLSPLKSNSISTLNLTALIQGFYNGSSMVSVNPITVTVELHDATTLEGIESQNGTLNNSGVGTFTFASAVDGVPYYIVLKSRNTIETWSATPIPFISGSLNFNFTTAATQAYGSNQKSWGSVYCIYSGDVNQDGLVDLSDLVAIDNDNMNYVSGNVVTDVNGDGLVDLSDLVIVDNNNMNYISEVAPPGAPASTIDYSGQTYHKVLIGTQYWLKENLNIGNIITGSQTQSNNGIIEKYCYNDLAANCITYGGLYQWNEAMQYSPGGNKVQGICPPGWHIPSISEFSTLATSVAGNSNALKSVGQGVDAGAGTNASGFSALLAGLRFYTTGNYQDLGGETYFWSSSVSGLTNAYLMDLSGYFADIFQYTVAQDFGFSIRCVKDGWFALQSPNGGENWRVGTTHNISWTSSNITNAKIQITTNNGADWTTVIASTPAAIGNYSWTIPNTPSAQCKIKLTDASDSTIQSISSSLFTIWIPTLSVSSPNGGENWKVGEIDTIKWSSSNVTNVRLDYTMDNGSNWTNIIGSTSASSGFYAWTIPFTPSVNCKVRIVDLPDTTIRSISTNKFTISNPPCPGLATVVYGSQTYNTVLIGNQCWLKENLNIGSMINGLLPQTNNSLIEKYCYGNNPANCTTYGGLYQWAESVQYQNGTTNALSPSPAFYGHVQGICPTGWHIPDSTEFATLKNTVNNDGNSLKAVGQGAFSGAGTDLSGFSALLSGTRFSDGSFANLGLYNYIASSTEGNALNIYYIDLGTDFDTIYVGLSSKSYGRTIRCIKDAEVSLLSPVGAENWKVGTTHEITWTSKYFTNARIELTTNNGASWSTIISSTPASSGSYEWTVPDSTSTQCKVRISNVIDTTIKSISTSSFTISPIPVITIISPNGGENWKVGEIDSIKWTSANVSASKIEYSTDNGISWSIVITSTPASVGYYLWTIPNTPSTQCLVKLNDVADTNNRSTSAGTFTIPPVPVISITSPNGGENWKVTEIDTIKWTSANVSDIKIEYTTNDGISWTTIVASTPAAIGHFIWTIPNSPSSLCKVRISDVADTNVKSISANTFTIATPPTVTLTSPVGGETWNVAEIHPITWTSSNITNVKIDYTTDGGTVWLTVVASVAASIGSFDWSIPNTPGQCKVRVSDESNSAIYSISSSDFTIANP
jgi:uncharacterized protein (TIGR02145 family)